MRNILLPAALILAAALSPGRASDDSQFFIAAKGQNLAQTNAGSPVIITNDKPFRFIAEFMASSTNGVTNVVATPPNKLSVTLVNDDTNDASGDFVFEQGFTNKLMLDQRFGAGTYSFLIQSALAVSNKSSLALPPDAYPAAPHIANWLDAQEIEGALPFVLQWDAPANISSRDLVFVDISNTNGDICLRSGGFFQPDALNGTNVAIEIPANALEHGQSYKAQLLFIKVGSRATNALLGIVGLGGYYRQTEFPIGTLPEPQATSRVQLSSHSYTANEADGSAVVTVTRVGEESESVSANLATSNGTALDGVNYTGVNTPVTFGPGITAVNVSIPLLNDYAVTGNRTVNIALTGLEGNAVFGNRTASLLTLLDAQRAAAGKLQFATASNAVSEATAYVPVTIARLSGSAGPVSVRFHTADGTAISGSDYAGTNGTLVIPALKTSAVLPIRIINDSANEGKEHFYVVLDGTSGGASLGTNLITKVTILDNDPGGVIALGSAAYVTNENSGAFQVTIKRSGSPGLAGGVTVDYATTAGTAAESVDYSPVSGTLTFGSNELVKTISIPVINDTDAEGSETLAFRLSNPNGGGVLGLVTNAILTIRDDESSVSLGSATYTAGEAGPALVVRVIRSGALITPVSVDIGTAGISATAGADFGATNATLLFPVNTAERTLTIPIKEDTVAEGSETFSVQLSNPKNGVQLGAITGAIATIVDNDSGGVVNLSTNSYTVSESATNAVITLVRSNGLASAATVELSTSDDTARSGDDYTGGTQTVTFNAGETVKKALIPIINNTTVQGNRTLRIALGNPAGGAALGSRINGALTIVEDDLGGVIGFKNTTLSTNENAGSFAVNIIRTGGKAGGVSVQYHTLDGTATSADYTATAGTLEFAPGETNKTLTIPIINDTLPEGTETLAIVLDNAAGGAAIGTNGTAALHIVDDESSISIGSPSYTVNESGTNVAITLLRSGAMGTAVSVDFATINGSATGGSGDFLATNGTVVFPANTAARTLLIKINNDAVVEPDESFTFFIHNPQGGVQLGTVTNSTISIVNDDFPGTLRFSAAAYSGTEGSNMVIRVLRTGGLAGGITVEIGVTGGTASPGADYTSLSGTLTFLAGETNKTVAIPILPDTLNEATETVEIALSNPGGGAVLGTPAAATLNLLNKPDPNAVPLNGPLFIKGTINGTAFAAITNSCIGQSDPNTVLQVTAPWTTGSGYSTLVHQLVVDVFPRQLGTLNMDNAGTHGFASYGIGDLSGKGRAWAVADGSSSTGSYGTFTLDAIDYGQKLASGRFTLHMKETTEGVVNPGYIDVIGSFRIGLKP